MTKKPTWGGLGRALAEFSRPRGPNQRVRVFMPSYPGPKIYTMNCLLEMLHGFGTLGTPYDVVFRMGGGAYLNTLQNDAMCQFLEDELAVGLLLVEHDAIWPNAGTRDRDGKKLPPFNALHRLMSRGKDIIAGFATNRSMPVKMMAGWYKPNGDLRPVEDPDIVDPRNGTPFEVEWAATHFMYVTRAAAVKIAEHQGTPLAMFDCSAKLFEVAPTSMRLSEMLAEHRAGGITETEFRVELGRLLDMAGYYQNDISFCRRARAAGCEIWVDPSFEVQHIGDYSYSRHDWMGQWASAQGKQIEDNAKAL